MSGNIFGQIFRLVSFGESHGPAMGAVIEGCPAGVRFDFDLLTQNLLRRRPGQSQAVSARAELDQPEVLSGVYEGKTLGTPIALFVRNQDARSQDYANLPHRSGHANDLWQLKFGHSDPRGGGRASGRETVSRVMGGSVAQMLLHSQLPQAQVRAYVTQIGRIGMNERERDFFKTSGYKLEDVEASMVRMPCSEKSAQATELLLQAQKEGRSYGGVAEVYMTGFPAGLGQPVFAKLKASMAMAFMSVGAVCGVELGTGFAAAQAEGSEFHQGQASAYGGERGGISTGEDICWRVAFKPTSSVLDVAKRGRHDPCIVPRVIPVLEAMAYLVLADHWLLSQLDR